MARLDFKLVTRNVADCQDFDCGIDSINKYVKDSYYPSIAQHAYAYNIIGNGKSLGYIQFLFRDVELDYFPDDISGVDPGIKANTLPAIHIRFLAIDKSYQRNRIGTAALETIIKRIQDLAEEWPVSMITIDARDELVEWYEQVGFKKMVKNSPGQDGITVAMYYSCIKHPEKLKEYMEEMSADMA